MVRPIFEIVFAEKGMFEQNVKHNLFMVRFFLMMIQRLIIKNCLSNYMISIYETGEQ